MGKFVLSFAVIICFSFLASAQSITPFVINSTGGKGNVPGYSNGYYLDWSVGEMTLVNTMRNGSGNNLVIITNGLLQPDYGPDHGNEDHKTLLTSSEIKVYPNPAVEYIDVRFLLNETGDVRMILYNSMGQQVFSKEFNLNTKTRTEHIQVGKLTQGSYVLFVEVKSPANIVKQGSFTIIKVN